VGLQALGREQIDRGAVVLVAGRDQPAARLILFGQAAQFVGHARPRLAERSGTGGVGLLRRVLQRGAHLLDLADAGAHLDRQVDREVPDVIRGEILEHVFCFVGVAMGYCTDPGMDE
jgi:hypothetical protein